MIVKNEASVIRRCIDSVRPLITHWVIVDTGSTDGTQDIIREYLKDLPGELHERPWRDFAHNRSEALALARPHAEFSLIIDADDALEIPVGYQMPELTADCYMMEIRDDPLLYWRKQLVRNTLTWFYRGVLHEFVTSAEVHSTGTLPLGMRRNHDGARRKDPSWFMRDVEVLERALEVETDPFLKSRYTFYLAQSYRDSGKKEKSLEHYLARSKLGGWQEEVYVSLYQSAKLKEALGYPDQEVIKTYQEATDAYPIRIEARHGASRLCRTKGYYQQGYEIAKAGLGTTLPPDALFAEPWIYETGLLDEFAVNAYWTGHHTEAIDACLKLIQSGKLGAEDLKRVSGNARASWDIASVPGQPQNLGALGSEDFMAQHALRPPRELLARRDQHPKVLLAILAKQKETMLPLYLECIEALDYPKSSIVLYIRTNNNTDNTEKMLRDWVARVEHLYAGVEFDADDVEQPVQQFDAHEWNQMRFTVLARIRNESLQRTLKHHCDFYFVCDVDNFIAPNVLRELVALNLPIVSPFLRSLAAERYYSNYHAAVDTNGYYSECDQYYWMLNRWVRGVLEVPVIHCTYLIRVDIIGELTYEDGSGRYEYVIFSDSARKAGIPQYLDNRQVYGYIAFDKGNAGHVEGGTDLARRLLRIAQPAEQVFSEIYAQKKWGGAADAANPFYSGPGSHDPAIVSPYVDAVREYLRSLGETPDVADLGCGDFSVGAQLRASCKRYRACDAVPAIIEYNRKKYAGIGVEFTVADITSGRLPKADVAIVRQVFQHLSNDHIAKALSRLASRYKHLIITEHVTGEASFTPNADIRMGELTRLGQKSGVVLTAPPFNLAVKSERILCEVHQFGGIIRTIAYTL